MAERRYYLRGEIDIANASQLRADLQREVIEHDADLLVDCSQLTFIDSHGIAVLLEAQRNLETGGRALLLVEVGDGPRQVFEALGLSDLVGVDRSAKSGSAEPL
jgi:anti-anti-sigma factor